MKVAYILNVPSPQINVPLFDELGRQTGWDIVMMTPDVARRKAFFERIRPKHFRLVRFPYADLSFLLLPMKAFNWLRGLPSHDDPVTTGFRSIKSLEYEKPDVVISNLSYYAYTWQAAAYCRKNRIPFLVQTEMKAMPDDPVKRLYVQVFARLARKFVFQDASAVLPWTEHSARFMEDKMRVPRNKVAVIPPAIDTKLFRPGKPRKADGKLKVLLVTRFTPYKRVDDALDALRMLDKSIELSIIGSGPEEKRIREKARGLNVKFLDKVPRERMRELYLSHDVLILTSKNEAIGMVVPEAMACGLPVVVSDSSGALTYMRPGVDSLAYTTGDVKDLARKIKSLKGARLRQSLGAKAAESIAKDFSLGAVAKRLADTIKRSAR